MTETKKTERPAGEAADTFAPLAMKDVIAAAMMMKRQAGDKDKAGRKAA